MRTLCQPQGYRQLFPSILFPGRKVALLQRFQTRILKPLCDLRRRKSKPVMCVLFAKELQIVRREIDDQQPSAWRQHASRLANGMSRLRKKVQHLVHDNGVGRRVRQSQRIYVAMSNLRTR